MFVKRCLINIFEKNTFHPDPEKDGKYIRKKKLGKKINALFLDVLYTTTRQVVKLAT